MNANITELRSLILNMLFAMQSLFLASTTWDFFLTVAIKEYSRTAILTGLSSTTLCFIVIPWVISIFLLSALLFNFIMHQETSPIKEYVHYIYGVLVLVYIVMFGLAIVNPIAAWPLAMNYFVNAVWAGILVYFRIVVKRYITV